MERRRRQGHTRPISYSAAGSMGRGPQRSRKGCPECRKRKVKCDEKKPECGECLRTGRVCRIIDSLFRPHSYSFLASSSQRTRPSSSREPRFPDSGGETAAFDQDAPDASADRARMPQQSAAVGLMVQDPSNQRPRARTASPGPRPWQDQSDREHSVPNISETRYVPGPHEAENALAGLPPPVTLAPLAEPSPRAFISAHIQSEQNAAETRPSTDECRDLLDSTHVDNDQDRCEIAFFLRYFAEEPGRWMDICCDHPYFSEQVALLSPVCALVRYSAVALAAKQLGYMKNPESAIRQTRNHRRMMQAFADSNLDFLWYGAKYYDKAIQILAQQLSREDSSVSQCPPWGLVQPGLTPESNEISLFGDHDSTEITLQALAACILCQYEDVTATMRAWSGHLNGICRLLRPFLNDTVTLPTALHIPQPNKAMDAVYWFFALNDMLDAYVNKRRTRLDFKKAIIWRRMGLPLDDSGHLMADYVHEAQAESIFFKFLIRLMCQLVNSDLGNPTEWSTINEEFDRWRAILPLTFSPISWPPLPRQDDAQEAASPDLFSHETWYTRDICALSMAFYNMARILLLIHRPLDVFLRGAQQNPDLLTTYHSFQQDLRSHAMAVISIARGAPNGTVRKYLLQPLYVAGRCLVDANDRQELLDILRQIDSDLGVFTDYRQKDLSEEWGIPYQPVEKNIVP